MPLSMEEVLHIAMLARLELTVEELEHYREPAAAGYRKHPAHVCSL
jgi:Asp-tRNA(Asn)/Glu-tRNA(Gln) amidotransferase C subunit